MNIQNENTFKRCLAEGVNLFLGAGFSLHANSLGKSLPVGDQLKKELLVLFERDQNSKLSLAQLCQIISSTQKEKLLSYFNSRFNVSDFDPAYQNLERVNIKSIFTTNIDDLVFKIFSDSNKYYINDIVLRGPSIAGSNSIDYIALHGTIRHANNQFDFSPIEISSSFERDKDKWFGYVGRIQTTPTLYWGYRVEDASVLQALAKDTTNGRSKAESWIVLREKDEEAIEYYSSLGFQIIIGDTLQLLNYFGQLKNPKKTSASSSSLINRNFKEYLLPDLSKTPVRTLNEFYLGAEPVWYDIYSGKIHKTSNYAKVKDAVNGEKHVVIIGGAITGKTTILKQLAHDFSGQGAIFVDEITPEKADLLVRDVDAEGREVLVIIDNAADASDAIQVMLKSNNLKIVAAERDYLYDSVAHKFPSKSFFKLDVSGLSDMDIQSIENCIPNDVQRKKFNKKVDDLLDVELLPTFYEVITSRITADSLVSRFLSAIRDYKVSNPIQHDLLLMICYMYHCRVPTSVDVASAFSRKYNLNVKDTLEILLSMYSLLSQYEGSLAETVQAYFVPRSRAVAEAVLKETSSIDLKILLETFHSEVSPTKISRYDIFKRMAYDATLTGKAFPNWKDGLQFYTHAFKKDPTHSLKQQGALYLSGKKIHEEAFGWIDEAFSMAGKQSPSVRNSYAIILFRANFDKPASAEVRSTLDESMDILQKCHRDDHRKIYHAKVFAEQAIKYYEKFPDTTVANDYLAKTIDWLTEELVQRPTDYKMRTLLRTARQIYKK